MFVQKQFVRLISSSAITWNSSKGLLAKLRKRTGYSFSNCKKALEMHDNDLQKAEKWLRDQAQELGWSKATKLGGRKAKEGLVAVVINRNHAAMVELNCETDFVSRNKYFQTLVDIVAKSCLNVVPTYCGKNELVAKELLDSERLGAITSSEGKTLADHVALTIGLVGENMVLKRAALISVAENLHVSGYSHPAPASKSEPMLGKYGALVAIRPKDKSQITGEKVELCRELCQHVVGMNPVKIGNPDVDKPQKNAEEETNMIYQEFLSDPTTTVEQVLHDAELEVIDFVRYECGEEMESTDAEQPSVASVGA